MIKLIHSPQFKIMTQRRGSAVLWFILDRLGSGVLGQGRERTKTKALEMANEKKSELAKKYLAVTSLAPVKNPLAVSFNRR